ncbi:hypothetical protein MMC16_005183 [Acarospora aff. strigata]|nr:hypothetical protein [Acarospora aff. strigata]
MGVTRTVLRNGNGVDRPQKGDEVTIEYTGCLYDEKEENNQFRGTKRKVSAHIKGEAKASVLSVGRFDSSIGRGDFKTPIGIGKVIKGMAHRRDRGSPLHLAIQ